MYLHKRRCNKNLGKFEDIYFYVTRLSLYCRILNLVARCYEQFAFTDQSVSLKLLNKFSFQIADNLRAVANILTRFEDYDVG